MGGRKRNRSLKLRKSDVEYQFDTDLEMLVGVLGAIRDQTHFGQPHFLADVAVGILRKRGNPPPYTWYESTLTKGDWIVFRREGAFCVLYRAAFTIALQRGHFKPRNLAKLVLELVE